jgi:hypothetical protein
MSKWLDKFKCPNDQARTASIDTLPTMSTLAVGESRKNEITDIKKYGNFTQEQLKIFLGEDWELYKDKPQALQLWAEILSDKEKMIKAGVYTKERYENLFNNER